MILTLVLKSVATRALLTARLKLTPNSLKTAEFLDIPRLSFFGTGLAQLNRGLSNEVRVAMSCQSRNGRTGLKALACGLVLAGSANSVEAATVTLAWDRNPESTVINYSVFAGTAAGVYTLGIAVGNRTDWTFTGLADNTRYYFAV